MKPFCEIIVADVMPALRALITKELMDEYGLNQTQVAQKLGITQPAVSQYRKELRGQNVRLLQSNQKIMSMIKELANEIQSDKIKPDRMIVRLCEICKAIREERLICQLHTKAYSSLQGCQICLR